MSRTLTQKLIDAHHVDGGARPGEELAIRIDQTLTQDATGTLVMLELEAMDLPRVRTDVSVQYVDHNLVQQDHKNADDHRFLRSACQRFGVWFSRPGNGVSHPVHQERFGAPGKTLLGSDSHTTAAGALGMLAMGAGGLDVALAMAGEPYRFPAPEVWQIRLEGRLRPWVSAKDVILELLRRHGVSGGLGRVLEYSGPGLVGLSVWDRHVLANMGTELGATASVFPADEEVRRFLRQQNREADFLPLAADPDAEYHHHETVDMSEVEPLIAMPSSPGNVRRVAEVAGEPIQQAYVGSSANPGFRDLAVVAVALEGKQVAPGVSLDINPASRQVLQNLAAAGYLGTLLGAGARLHQTGCNGCIGMGQAPATGQISLRTVPRNFPGRSGTREDKVCLVSPETAAASALRGHITDPRELRREIPRVEVREPRPYLVDDQQLEPPPEPEAAAEVELVKGPNIASLPELEPLPEELELPVLLAVGDDISTDEILPGGTRVLPFRSNVPAISQFVFRDVDGEYARRAKEQREEGGHALVAGENYGQGSSREHAALAPRHLGLRLVLARSFARIHRQNLVNFGVLPLTFAEPDGREAVARGDRLRLEAPLEAMADGRRLELKNVTQQTTVAVEHDLSPAQVEVLRQGGLINAMRRRLSGESGGGDHVR